MFCGCIMGLSSKLILWLFFALWDYLQFWFCNYSEVQNSLTDTYLFMTLYDFVFLCKICFIFEMAFIFWLYSFLRSSLLWGCLHFWGHVHIWGLLHYWCCLHLWGCIFFTCPDFSPVLRQLLTFVWCQVYILIHFSDCIPNLCSLSSGDKHKLTFLSWHKQLAF